MGLLDFLPKIGQKDNSQLSYLSLSISQNEVSGTIWNFEGEAIFIAGFAKKKFISLDNLINVSAVVIDKAGEQAKTDVNKTVFGLSAFYLEDGKPNPEIAKVLKELTNELDLTAQAFIPLSAAVNHYLKTQSGQTPKAILIGSFDNFLEIHLLENNQIVKTLTARGSADSQKVKSLIKQLVTLDQSLPARLILYPANHHLQKELSSEKWHDIFTVEPRIDNLTDEELGSAIAFAQAADILGHEPQPLNVENISPLAEPPKESKSANMGFMAGEDILLKKQIPTSDEGQEDIIDPPANQQEIEKDSEQSQDIPQVFEATSNETQRKHKSRKFIPNFGVLFSLFKLPSKLSPQKLGIGLIVLILFTAIGSFVLARTISSAEIEIKVNAKTQQDIYEVEIAQNSDDDQVAGQLITTTTKGAQKLVASGSKKLGNPAKGTVKVLNWDKNPKTFSQTAQMITDDGLKFTLDSEVQVASRSATTPGESKSAATATDVGAKHNIAQGTDLQIVGFDEIFYSAVADTAFTGGDEHQATVVSQEDLNRLEKSLTDTLTSKVKEELKNKIGDRKLDDQSIVIKVLSKNFDKKAEEEASLVNLEMEVEASAIVYSEQELKDYLAKNLEDIPENLEALGSEIKFLSFNVKRSKDKLIISGKLEAGLVPKFNEDELKDKIKGKSTKQAREIIKSSPEVVDVIVNFKPNIPFVDSLPTNKSKIKLKIEAS